jgi:Sec-independent protein translocase protein TatA
MNGTKNESSKLNWTLVLVIALVVHNFYLQTKMDETISVMSNAVSEARQANRSASQAASYARQAADNASEASEYSENASRNAYNAYLNSFGSQCWSCP